MYYLTGARKMARRLMTLVRHLHCGELVRAQQLGQAYCITPVRLHSIAGLLRNERGGHHRALVAAAFQLVCRDRILSALLHSKTSDDGISPQALPRAFGSPPPWQETPRDAGPRPPRPLSAIATALRNFDASIPTKVSPTTRSPCLRLCPDHPGNPRRNIEGESPHFVEGTYSLEDMQQHSCAR